MIALHFGDPTESTGRSVCKYSHRRSAFACRIPATGLHVDDQSRCQAHAAWRGHCLGLTENLCNVNVVQTLLPLQQIESHAASCRSIETSNFQKLCVRHPSSNSVRHSAARFAPRSRSIRSSKHSTRMSPLDRFTSELIGAQLGKLPGSENFSSFEPVCSSLSSRRTCSTMGICHGSLYISLLLTREHCTHHADPWAP